MSYDQNAADLLRENAALKAESAALRAEVETLKRERDETKDVLIALDRTAAHFAKTMESKLADSEAELHFKTEECLNKEGELRDMATENERLRKAINFLLKEWVNPDSKLEATRDVKKKYGNT